MDISDLDTLAQDSSTTLFTLEGGFEDFSTKALHAHDCHQLLRIRSGTSLLVEKARQQPLFSNYTAFIPTGVPHRSVVLGSPVHYKSIYLDRALWPEWEGSIRIFDMSPLGTALFDRIYLGGKDQKDRGFHLKCLALLLTMLAQEMERPSDITRIPVPRDEENLKLAEFIKTHYRERLGLKEFCQVVHYSPRHLSRRFKKDLGISLFAYLKLYRIFRAAVLLATSPEPVAVIGYSVGYDSLSSFYKDFKDLFSTPPGTFRNKRDQQGITGR